MPAAAFSSASCLRDESITLAPDSANCVAIASPMPFDAPVTSATLPSSRRSMPANLIVLVVNRLAGETSPYLQQHKDNPVDWYPWSEDALGRARAEDRPILRSVGYSACHWCHVMAHESFEDPETARVMNDLFVNVKVDREERPDVDAIYMEAVQAMTGHGGWPMTVFLTPTGEPFFGGTYFPREARAGIPSFTQVCTAVAEAWRERRSEVDDQAGRLTAAIGQLDQL